MGIKFKTAKRLSIKEGETPVKSRIVTNASNDGPGVENSKSERGHQMKDIDKPENAALLRTCQIKNISQYIMSNS